MVGREVKGEIGKLECPPKFKAGGGGARLHAPPPRQQRERDALHRRAVQQPGAQRPGAQAQQTARGARPVGRAGTSEVGQETEAVASGKEKR